MYAIYVMYSETIDRYYVGMSSDPSRRVERHNSQKKGWTRRGRPWILVYHQRFADQSMALRAEKLIKSWKSRAMIEALIHGRIDVWEYL